VSHKQNLADGHATAKESRAGIRGLIGTTANVHGSSEKLKNWSPAKKSPGPFWATGA